jgi:hypothetical protein
LVRLGELMDKHKGKINIEIAKQIISDHYDVYLLKDENPCSRTVCSHYDLDAREYMSQADRPKPFSPHGAVDGSVVDSTLAKQMSFVMRYGNSCGIAFDKNTFCDQHMQWNIFRPYLKDRPTQPWSTFSCLDYNKKQTKNKERKFYLTKKKRNTKTKTMKKNNF